MRKNIRVRHIFLIVSRNKGAFESEDLIILWLVCIIVSHSKQISVPTQVKGLVNIKTIAVGAFHNLALSESGQVWAWGNNEYGQLGTGDTQPRSTPVAVKNLRGLDLVSTWPFGCDPKINLTRIRGTLKTTFASKVEHLEWVQKSCPVPNPSNQGQAPRFAHRWLKIFSSPGYSHYDRWALAVECTKSQVLGMSPILALMVLLLIYGVAFIFKLI